MTFKEALAVSILMHSTKGVIPNFTGEERLRFLRYLESIQYEDIFVQVHKAISFIENNLDFEKIEEKEKARVERAKENALNKSAEKIIPWNEHFAGKHFNECKENKNS